MASWYCIEQRGLRPPGVQPVRQGPSDGGADLGDRFSQALALVLGEPPPHAGDDFSRTDVFRYEPPQA